jgi:hypothetical protein
LTSSLNRTCLSVSQTASGLRIPRPVCYILSWVRDQWQFVIWGPPAHPVQCFAPRSWHRLLPASASSRSCFRVGALDHHTPITCHHTHPLRATAARCVSACAYCMIGVGSRPTPRASASPVPSTPPPEQPQDQPEPKQPEPEQPAAALKCMHAAQSQVTAALRCNDGHTRSHTVMDLVGFCACEPNWLHRLGRPQNGSRSGRRGPGTPDRVGSQHLALEALARFSENLRRG